MTIVDTPEEKREIEDALDGHPCEGWHGKWLYQEEGGGRWIAVIANQNGDRAVNRFETIDGAILWLAGCAGGVVCADREGALRKFSLLKKASERFVVRLPMYQDEAGEYRSGYLQLFNVGYKVVSSPEEATWFASQYEAEKAAGDWIPDALEGSWRAVRLGLARLQSGDCKQTKQWEA